MRADRARSAVDIFTILVAMSVAIALAALLWRAIGAFSSSEDSKGVTATPPPAATDIAPILALQPFGKADPGAAPPTSLALQLRGVLLTMPRDRSTALIAPTGGIPVAYAIGQPVPGGGTIEDIAVDRVLLRVNGRLERLDLPQVSVATASPAPSGAGTTGIPAYAPPPSASLPSAAPALSAAALFQSLPATLTVGGFRVGAPLSPGARQAGLQPGDIIDRVNGTPAEALATDRAALGGAMATGVAQIGVKRADRHLTLSLPLR